MSKDAFPYPSHNPNTQRISGRFFPAGTGAPTGLKGRGIASVTRTGVGAYLVTLADKWGDLTSFNLGLQLHAAADVKLQLGDVDLVAKTIVIRALAVAAAVEIAANANSSIAFSFDLSLVD